MNDEPKRIFVGSFESGVTHLVVPAAATRPAEAVFNAERQRHQMLANKAKLATLQSAKAQDKLKRAMQSVFGHGKRRGR